MGLLLPLIALLLLVLGGGGCALLLLPRQQAVNVVELAALSVVLGSAVVAGTSFVLGLVVSGLALQAGVTLACLGLAASGKLWGACVHAQRPALGSVWLATILCVIELGLLAWLSGRYVLGWDSVVVWEFKARAAALNAGSMPLAYYLSLGTRWSHPEYPLLLPLTEAWLFDWAGRADEQLVRWLFVVYDAALLAAMYVFGMRLGGSRWSGLLGMGLVFLVPQLTIGPGSTTTGWADFVVGVCYLIAAGYLVLALAHRVPGLFGLVGVLCAAMVWTKQEGVFLWLCLALTTAVFVHGDRLRSTAFVLLPALVVVSGWRVFLLLLRVPGSPDYLPINVQTFGEHADRLPQLVAWTAGQMVAVRPWGILWPAFALAAVLTARERLRQQLLLTLLVVLPLVPDVATFVFSAWTPYMGHVESALPRLMGQVAPVAVLAIVTAVRPPRLPSGVTMGLALSRKAG